MSIETFYFPRLLARLIDLLMIGLITQFFQLVNLNLNAGPFVWYFFYNVVVIVFAGTTVGKYSLSLEVQTDAQGLKRVLNLIIREILLVLLLPILVLNFLCMSHFPVHDRLSGTKVVRNES